MNETQLSVRLGLAEATPNYLAVAWSKLKVRLVANKDELDEEIADLIDLLCACLSGGLGYRESLEYIEKRASGVLALKIGEMTSFLNSGESLAVAMLRYEGSESNQHLRELALKLALADQLGSPVVPALKSLSNSVRASDLLSLRATANRKETKMQFPLILLVLPVTVLFALFPSTQFLNLNF